MSQEGNQLQNQGLSLTHGRRHTELKDLPTREYLDETVVPILTEGLAILGKVCSKVFFYIIFLYLISIFYSDEYKLTNFQFFMIHQLRLKTRRANLVR